MGFHNQQQLWPPPVTAAEPLMEQEVRANEKQLVEQLQSALGKTGYFLTVPCEVTVHVTPAGHVSLCGVVPSYYVKQKAQVAAMKVNGVHSLQNDLVVL